MERKNRGVVRFFNLPDLPDVQAVCGINVTNAFARHVHNGFCIGLVQRGERIIDREGASAIVPENGLFVINPGTSHTCRSRHEEHSYSIICVEAEKMRAIASQISEKAQPSPYFKKTVLFDGGLRSKMRRLFSLMDDSGPSLERELVLDSLLSSLILRYGDKPPMPCKAGSHHGAIQRVCEFIKTHYADHLSLKELSRVACLSPFYLQRLFLENTGMSPHGYMIHCRIKKARELLAEGHSIAGVALDAGFVDQSHFTRSFKQVTGTTPGGYISMERNHTRQREAVIQ
jgi:AraC-like DNA-binding protein